MFRPYTRAVSVGNFKAPVSAGGGGGGGGDVTPDAVNWSDITYDEPSDNVEFTFQRITGIDSSITLKIGFSPSNAWGNLGYTATGATLSFSSYPPCPTCVIINSNDYTFSVSNNQYVYFGQYGTVDGTVITVKNASSSDAVLDTFTCYYNAMCFLTTTVVNYMGLSDNGPELTAMRRLRSHYENVQGYEQLLEEYANVSRQIVLGIKSANAEHIEYTYIYNTVIDVMNHVNAEEWQQAHDKYMSMYTDLKSRYLTS